MQKSSNQFGITLKDPGFLTITGRGVEDWKKEIRQDVSKNGNPQIVVLLLNNF
jgi:hypothetical protein